MIEKDILNNPSFSQEDRRRIQKWLDVRQEMKWLISLGYESEEMIKLAAEDGMTLDQYCKYRNLRYEFDMTEISDYLNSRSITLPEELMTKLRLEIPSKNPYRYEYLNDYLEPVNLAEIICTKEACDHFIENMPPFAFTGDIRCIDSIFDEFSHISMCDGFHLCYVCSEWGPHVFALPDEETQPYVEKNNAKKNSLLSSPVSKDLPADAVNPCSVITTDDTADGIMEEYIFSMFVRMLDGDAEEEYYDIVFQNPLNQDLKAIFLRPSFWKPVFMPEEKELRFYTVSKNKEHSGPTRWQKTYEEVNLVICKFDTYDSFDEEVGKYPSKVLKSFFIKEKPSQIHITKTIVAKDPRSYNAECINYQIDWASYKKATPHLLSFTSKK